MAPPEIRGPGPDGPRRGNILVIRGGALGDFILTLPVLAALRAGFPGNRIEVLGYPQLAALALASGVADTARNIEARPLAGFFARGGDLDPELAAYFGKFHLILRYLFDPDLIFQTNVSRVSRAGFLQGPHRPDESSDAHASEQLLRPLERLAVFDADPVPRIRGRAADASRDGPLAVHPGSGSERKNWPESRWAALLESLAQTEGSRFLLVGGEAEGDRLERLAAGLPRGAAVVLRSRPLPEVASHLAACRGFLGHDSGITHLAAALGLPGLILWGPSRVRTWRPRCDRMEVLEAGDQLERLAAGPVTARIRALLPGW